MRLFWLCLTIAALGLLPGGLPSAAAQTAAEYNYNRATAHFLGSRYSYRVLYSSRPGSVSMTYSPFGYQGQYIEPSYTRQRITPYGYERYETIPGIGGATMTPFSFSNYYMPGYGYTYIAPNRGRVVEYYSR